MVPIFPKLGGHDYLYVTSKISGGFLDISTAEQINAEEHRKIFGRCDVRQGDLLLTKDGVNTGNAAINHLEEPFSLLSSVAFLRFDSDSYEPRYFLQFILSNTGQVNIKNMMSGNAITRLTLEKIQKLRFPLPPTLEEQRVIAEGLSDVDALQSALDRLIAKKRDIKRGAMQALLTGRVRLPGVEHKPGYKRTEVGEIPQDWEVRPLGDVLKIKHGKSQKALIKWKYPVLATGKVGEQTPIFQAVCPHWAQRHY